MRIDLIIIITTTTTTTNTAVYDYHGIDHWMLQLIALYMTLYTLYNEHIDSYIDQHINMHCRIANKSDIMMDTQKDSCTYDGPSYVH